MLSVLTALGIMREESMAAPVPLLCFASSSYSSVRSTLDTAFISNGNISLTTGPNSMVRAFTQFKMEISKNRKSPSPTLLVPMKSNKNSAFQKKTQIKTKTLNLSIWI